jgi:hypothetical protein
VTGLRLVGALVGAVVLLAAAPARARVIDDRLEVYGYAQLWATLWEEMADARGLYQHPSGDEAATSLSGFSLARARVGVRWQDPASELGVHLQVKLDHAVELLDAVVAWRPDRAFSLHLGQQKIPSSAEALADDRSLDFILRTDLALALDDYALSRAEHPISVLYGLNPNLRDLGVAVKGELGGGLLAGRYVLMASNGLGANLYLGGSSRKEFFTTNRAQLFYGARLEAVIAGLATAGLFGSYNRHDDMVFNSGRAVYDLDRRAAGADLQVRAPGTGLRLGAMVGGGRILDDFNGDGKTDLRYAGFSGAAVWDLAPLGRALGWRIPDEHALELAARFERMEHEVDASGLTVRRERMTVGVNYVAGAWGKVMVDYLFRRTDDPSLAAPFPANDALIASFQAAF